jgi:hypothetical protein
MKPSVALAVIACAALFLAPSLAVAAPPAASASAKPEPSPPAPVEDTPAQRATKLRDQGNEAMLGMRYADALGAYTKALELAPDEVGLYYSLARAHEFLGEYPQALESLETFDKKAPPEARAKVGDLKALYAEIRPRVSLLNLSSDVAGARVLVRNKVIGVTPLPPMRLLAGAATLQIELDGYFTEAREVTLPGGGELALRVELHAKSSSGLLSITTNPMGALVSVDGAERGTSTPKLELALAAGPHEVSVKREGYDAARIPIVLSPGSARDVSIPLEPTRSVLTRWWFWTAVGVVVVGGVALTYALTTERSGDHGSLTPGRVSGP